MKRGLGIIFTGAALMMLCVVFLVYAQTHNEVETLKVRCYDNHNNIIDGAECYDQKNHIIGLSEEWQNSVVITMMLMCVVAFILCFIGLGVYANQGLGESDGGK